MDETWATVHAEREALIADLDGLGPEQWARPSLCGDWTVHEVVAHLVDVACTTRIGFVSRLAAAGFDFDRQNARGVRRRIGRRPEDTLAHYRRVARRTATPPAPLDSRLVEEIVHGEDIRRPLGLTRTYPREAVVRSLRLQVGTPASLGGARERVAGVRLVATDAEVTIGEGPAVSGPVLSLLLVAAGRPVGLEDLTGDGLAELSAGLA